MTDIAPDDKPQEFSDPIPLSRTPTVANDSNLHQSKGKGMAFWMVFVSLCLATLLRPWNSLTSVSTALPTIVSNLHGDDFVWVGSAYALAATAFLPMFGTLANLWGRKRVLLGVLVAFVVGSAISGAAKNMSMLIAGRTIQGVGSGGIMGMTQIIIADLVPLRQRGPYLGIIGAVFAFAAAIGPPVGGVLADKGPWRWLFYLNLPLGAIAILFALLFLNFRVPKSDFKEKLAQMDWIGNFLIIASTASSTIALTWGGVQYPWTSAHTLVPLLVGFAGFGVFAFYEARYAKFPVVPAKLFATRTAFSGYLMTFLHGFVMMAAFYYVPVFFQTSKEATPIGSAVDTLGTALTVAPGGIATGVSIRILGLYRPQILIGWIFIVIGFGLFSMFNVNTTEAALQGYQVLMGIGFGMEMTSTQYPILASVGIEDVAPSLALFMFVRSFAQTWGITIGSTVLQNELSKRLPKSFVEQLPSGLSIVYATIPQIPSIPEPLRTEVKVAFAQSLSTLWKVMIGLAGLGFFVALLMKELPMHLVTDEKFGLEEKQKEKDEEKANVDNVAT